MRDQRKVLRRKPQLELLEPRMLLDASALQITEFAADNDSLLLDYEGDSSDWIEIYNSGPSAVDMSGLHLTDDAEELDHWAFPAGTILDAGGYLVVFASNKDLTMPNGELHTNFALSAGGEYLALTDSSLAILDEYSPEYPAQIEDVTYGRRAELTGSNQTLVADGDAGRAWSSTSSIHDQTWTDLAFDDTIFPLVGQTGFGYENDPGGGTNFLDEISTNIPSGTSSLYLRVNFSLTSLVGIDGLTLRMRYDDGFVAYVNGVKVAEANAPDSPQWNSVATTFHDDSLAEQFQEFDVSEAIPHLQVGTNVLAIQGLNVSSGSSDMLISPELVARSAVLAVPAEFGFLDKPTPGYGNVSTVFAGFAEAPHVDVPHGFYETPQVVSLATSTADAIIVYTTDGSTPEVDSGLNPLVGSVASGPIVITETTTLRARTFGEGYKPSQVTTATYVFLDDVIQQSPNGETPSGWANNGVNGQAINYGIDPDIIALYGAEAVKDSLASLPSFSITTDLEHLFDPETGIYVNATNRGRDWERPASLELIYPDATEGFTINAGVRIRGGYSRNDFNPKHAFRFYFRGDYGATHLEYPLFGEEGADEYDVLDLRTAQNYSWSSEANPQNSFLREVFARDLQADLGQPYTRSQYYHLYLDGVYWGVFQTQERAQEYYGESYLGGDESDYDVVKADLAVSGGTEVSAGNDQAWRQLFDAAEALAANPARNGDLYWTMQGLNPDGTRDATLPVLLDVENLIDYMSIIFFTGGYDSGLSRFLGDNRANNWFGIYNRETADQGFQFFIHDNEHSLGAGDGIHGTLSIDRTGPFNNGNQNNFAQFNPQYLHQDLLLSSEYRQRFIDRVQENFFNSGALTVEQNLARLSTRFDEVEPAIIAEAARWGDSKTNTPLNKSHWLAEVNWLTSTYFPQRGNIVLNQLRNDGLFTNFSAPNFNQHGGIVTAGFEVAISASPGTIYYTTDGITDPRAIGGGVNDSMAVNIYSSPLELTEDVTIKARLRTPSGEWSGLVEASFSVLPLQGDFDRNDTVSGADFLLWQQSFGMSVANDYDGADGNGDSMVDGADLSVWRSHYGERLPSGTVSGEAISPLREHSSETANLATVDVATAWELINQPSKQAGVILVETNHPMESVCDLAFADSNLLGARMLSFDDYIDAEIFESERREPSWTDLEVFPAWQGENFDKG